VIKEEDEGELEEEIEKQNQLKLENSGSSQVNKTGELHPDESRTKSDIISKKEPKTPVPPLENDINPKLLKTIQGTRTHKENLRS